MKTNIDELKSKLLEYKKYREIIEHHPRSIIHEYIKKIEEQISLMERI